MRDVLKLYAKTGIVLFCLWHMAAVAIYAVPREAKGEIATWSRDVLIPKVMPYMLTTSQWQLWNIFAPDPLRRVTYYHIQAKENDEWRTLEKIETGRYPRARHSTHFKLFINLLDEGRDDLDPIIARWLKKYCIAHSLQPRTIVRLQYVYYVVPLLHKPMPPQWWASWRPSVRSYPGLAVRCPTASS